DAVKPNGKKSGIFGRFKPRRAGRSDVFDEPRSHACERAVRFPVSTRPALAKTCFGQLIANAKKGQVAEWFKAHAWNA
ncbi:hypothetical protein AB9F45_39415, partial [Rhizobium leguminosarum]|uniref:hypothetical protein n=1 Tax=Rhizobium leguminosarum TaxID=384 RepID=UPI003F9567A6